MLRNSVFALVCVAALSGCGESRSAPGAAAATESAAPAPAAEAAAPAAVASRADAIAALVSEKPVRISFDTCPVSDDGWTGDSDPYGTIKCGEVYTVTYSAATGLFTTTGLNEGSNAELTSAAGGATAADGGISIWGATFAIGENGVVATSDGVAIGHYTIS